MAEGSFWKTVPGMITAIGGLLSGVAGLITALHLIGYFDPPPGNSDSAHMPAVTGAQLEPLPMLNEPAPSAGSTWNPDQGCITLREECIAQCPGSELLPPPCLDLMVNCGVNDPPCG